jgi:hypothetical protein
MNQVPKTFSNKWGKKIKLKSNLVKKRVQMIKLKQVNGNNTTIEDLNN